MSAISDFCQRVVASELRQASDAELLGRFVAARDEAAFAAMVRRHGPMVYRVCRGVLRSRADAEDASQATFLVLAQKAGRVRKRTSLPSWLHGVAFRTARKMRAAIARRQAADATLPAPEPASPADLTVREADELLHEELGQLPARYRAPLVLCYLQGKTHDEAAAELGWTLTAFRGRLEQARKHLGGRLRRRGLAPGAALLTGAVAEAGPTLPAAFAVQTARAAALEPGTAVAGGLVSPATAHLTREVLRSMSPRTLQIAGLVALATALVACGWLANGSTPAAPRQAPSQSEPTAAPAAKAARADRADGIVLCCKKRLARIKADRSDLTWLGDEADDGEFIQYHRVSPDGKSVAFMHQTRAGPAVSVWEFDQPWPGKVLTTSFVTDIFWMPDGKHLVLSNWGGVKDGLPANFKFRSVDVATLKAEELNIPDGHWASDVAPDGKWFLTMKTADRKNTVTGAEFYRVDRATGQAQLLFDRATPIVLPRWRICPDGVRIAGLKLDGQRRLQVFVGDPGAKELRQVTREASGVSQFCGWSPSGKKVLYIATRLPAEPKVGDAYHERVVAIGTDGQGSEAFHENEAHFRQGPDGKPVRSSEDTLMGADWR